MKTKIIFFSYLLFSLNFSAFSDEFGPPQSDYGDDCGVEVDLNRTKPLSDMAMLDQDGSGTCYAHVAAQLIEFENRKRGINLYPSPIDLAAKQRQGFMSWFDDNNLDGGLVQEVIDSVNSKGITSRSCVQSKVETFTRSSGLKYAQFATLLEAMSNFSFASTPEEYQFFLNNSNEEIQESLKALKGCDYSKTIEDLEKIGLLGQYATTILNELVVDCKLNKLPYQISLSQFDTPGKTAKGVIDSFLQKNQPAYARLCSKTFKRKDSTDLRAMSGTSGCGNHVVLIVGKRRNSAGKCEYLVRNSWGADWSPPGVDCALKDTGGGYYQDEKERERELDKYYASKGQSWDVDSRSQDYLGCWFSEDQIVSNTYSVGGVR